MNNSYRQVLDLIEFEPGSRFGYAKKEFDLFPQNEVVYKGDLCEFFENGTLQKLSEIAAYCGTDYFSPVLDKELEQSAASLRVEERLTMSIRESLARSTGRAFGGTDSGCTSSSKSSFEQRQKYLQSDLPAKSVQLDYETANPTETIPLCSLHSSQRSTA